MNRRRVMFLALLLVLAASAGACRVFRGDAGKGQIVFSHSDHLEHGDCSDCHEGVESSTGATAGKFIPVKKGCANCHDDVMGKCQMCHRGPKGGVSLKRVDRKLKFSHAAHASRVGKQGCASCHPAANKGGGSVPGHAGCDSCHKKSRAALDCAKCHIDLTRYKKPAATLSHGPGFVKSHGTTARQNVRACVQCHDQTKCADCHSGAAMTRASIRFPEQVNRRFIHRGDYLSRHAVEARSDPTSCRSCHGQRQCRSCHAINGLAANLQSGKRLRLGGKATHPAGWMTPTSTTFHGHQARRDIGRCASCHDRGAASNCVGCHKVGGMGGNPHPVGWSWGNKSDQCRNSTMCATCHAGGKGCK